MVALQLCWIQAIAQSGRNLEIFLLSEWLFVRARTNRILAIRTEYDHVTIQGASRDKLR